MALVQLDNVSKVYPGGVRAVDSVSLTVADQEFVVLVGPSGCGKSTTLRMVAGLEDISSGTIQIGERVVNRVAPKDRNIAMVFQNYALYPHMTVYKNMAFGLKLRRVAKSEIDRRVREAAKILEIEHLFDRKPRQLSGGQRQRVAVGRAIVMEPAAFLFDEPLSNLDAKLRVTTRAELKRLHQRLRTTTLYVTHDQEEAMTLGDRIVVMREGVIQQADSPLMTYNYPVNRFVAGFIGMPPMNFFDGALKIEDGRMVFEEGRLERGASVGKSGAELTLPGKGFRLSVPRHLTETLGGAVGRHVVLGIRPEHISLKPPNGGGSSSGLAPEFAPLDVKLNVIEPLGSDMDVYMSTALNESVVGRVEAQGGLALDARATAYVDMRKVHVFEPGETGMSLSGKASSSEHSHALA
jgi:multiple sugar transport system ATP-binding protein